MAQVKSSTLTSQKYITPFKRSKTNTNSKLNTNILDKQLFPSLVETIKRSTKKVMNFALATKKVEEIIDIKPKVSDIKPGWIHLRMINGKLQYRYNMIVKNNSDKEDKILGDYLFKKRVTLQQWERDMQNELLGDLSPYWNTKTVLEMHNNDNDIDKYYDDDENYSSEYSDSYD
jgi:hypothetical protein